LSCATSTSVLQYAGLKALALKVSSFLVAKKSFRFHFFCNLGSGKLFCLVQFLIELLGVKARTSQSRFPLSAMLPKKTAHNNETINFERKSN
jgi:hypothetical protein